MNARKIKRFINLFRLNILIANRRGLLEQGVVEIAQLARWNAIVARWPDFVDWAMDQAFLKRLSEASELWATSHQTSHAQTKEHATTLLAPYLKDPRIRRFVGNRQLFSLLRSFLGPRREIDAPADTVRPYVELSDVAGPLRVQTPQP
jgi:hypothetical protein